MRLYKALCRLYADRVVGCRAIIGILAAIAVPQYNRVVHKSRMMAWTPLARAWAQAGEMCSLAKGSACCFDEVVFDFPGQEQATPLGLKVIQGIMGEPTNTNGDWRFFHVTESIFPLQGLCQR